MIQCFLKEQVNWNN